MEFLPEEEIRFYTDVREHSCTFRYKFHLKEAVRETEVRTALQKTLALFPRFAMRPLIRQDGSGVILVPNDAPLPIHFDGEPRALGTEETNGYLFRIIIEDNTLTVSFFHAMTDGLGAIRFMTHVIYYYMLELGYEVDGENIIMSGEDADSPESNKTLIECLKDADIPDPDEASKPQKPQGELFHVPEFKELFYKEGYHVVVIECDAGKWMKVVHENETTPLCLTFALLSRAVRRVYDVGDKIIATSFAIDIRDRLHSSSLSEMTTIANLYYLPEYDDMPLKDACAHIRETLNKETALPVLKQSFYAMFEYLPLFKKKIDLRDHEKRREFMLEKEKQPNRRLFISNLGRIKFPKDIASYIDKMESISIPTKKDKNLVTMSCLGTAEFKFSCNGMDTAIESAFLTELENCSIDCHYSDHGIEKGDYLGELMIEE